MGALEIITLLESLFATLFPAAKQIASELDPSDPTVAAHQTAISHLTSAQASVSAAKTALTK